MKILQAANSFKHGWSSGGVARVAYDMSLALTLKGHDVSVFTTDKGLNEHINFKKNQLIKLDGMNVYYFHNLSDGLAKRGISIPYYSFFISREKIKEFDVIHIHEHNRIMNIFLYYYAKKYSIPYVLQSHGSLPIEGNTLKKGLKFIFFTIFSHRLLRDASKVIALSQMEARQYRSMGVLDEKIVVIPNGIDLSEYAVLPPKGLFKRKFGIKEEEKIVLYLGRIHKGKGIDFLINSFFYLLKNDTKNVKLVIAGPDDGYLSQVRCLVNSLGLDEKVLFTGMLSENDKISAYFDSYITVNVEPINVYGLVPLESVACSTPVIVSKNNAISEIVNLGKFGFSINYGNISDLSNIINKLISDDALREEMGQNGREFVFTNFSWNSIITKLEKIYMEVAESKLI